MQVIQFDVILMDLIKAAYFALANGIKAFVKFITGLVDRYLPAA